MPSEKAEKPEKRLRVRIAARPRVGEQHHKYYWAQGVRLELGGDFVEVECTELELSWLKADKFIVVHESLKEPAPAVTPILPELPPAEPLGLEQWTNARGGRSA